MLAPREGHTADVPPAGGRAGPAGRELLRGLTEKSKSARREAETGLERFLNEPSAVSALLQWLQGRLESRRQYDASALARLIVADIAMIDEMLTAQVNEILHHPSFQALEAAWRGLKYLVDQTPDSGGVKIRVLNISWQELANDLGRAIEFDQSQIFHKVYSEEFGRPGGEPFGVLIGDYQIRHRPGGGHRVDDIATLESMSEVAAAAFAPFIAGLDPAFLGLDGFDGLGPAPNLQRTFEQAEYIKWKSFRERADSRFIGLTLPRVLMRRPYSDDVSRAEGFRFFEDVDGIDRRKYLWANAAFPYAAVLIRAYARYGWPADVRGVQRGEDGGGLVTGLTVDFFETDRDGLAPKYSTDVLVSDFLEKELADCGFVPLCHCKNSEFAAFYSSQSTQKPKTYDTPEATENARLSAMLQHILCAGRFAHYLKIIAREKVGSYRRPEELQRLLHDWLNGYTTGSDTISLDQRARYPLREGRVRVREHRGKPGSYICEIHLRPHYQLDQLSSSIRLVTELSQGTPA